MKVKRMLAVYCMVACVPLFLEAVLLWFAGQGIVFRVEDPDRPWTGSLFFLGGAIFLALGVILHVTARARPAPVVVPTPAPPPTAHVEQDYEVKRSPIELASAAPDPGRPSLDERLESINREMGRVKVRYGLGELSKESYARIMGKLEAERARLEMEWHESHE